VLGLLILLILPPIAASPIPLGAILTRLPFGWWQFLRRNIPHLTINWGLISTGFICSVLAVLVANWLLGALFKQLQQPSRGGEPPRRWLWRWTISLYCGLWLLFAIAFGAAGVLRHTAWLMEYREPWYQERINSYSEFRMMDGLIQQLGLENNEDLESTRKALLREKTFRRQTLVADEFNVILYGDKSNKVAAYVIIPRQPQLVTKGQFGASMPGGGDLVRPISELQQTLAELELSYPSKGPR
jgi:hypothetical protein